jgi:signal transduction histidine kinase
MRANGFTTGKDSWVMKRQGISNKVLAVLAGKGRTSRPLLTATAPGHWGLRGMRERAKIVGGNFEVWSEHDSGTEVELTLPAASAYAKPAASRWSIFSRIGRS